MNELHAADLFGEVDGVLRGGVYRLVADLAAVDAALRAAGWRTGVLDAPHPTKEALLDGVGKALEFPAYYGRNLDALWDCLTDLDVPTALVWPQWQLAAVAEPRAWADVMDVLSGRTHEEPACAVVLR